LCKLALVYGVHVVDEELFNAILYLFKQKLCCFLNKDNTGFGKFKVLESVNISMTT
jgi:hypothetical protein